MVASVFLGFLFFGGAGVMQKPLSSGEIEELIGRLPTPYRDRLQRAYERLQRQLETAERVGRLPAKAAECLGLLPTIARDIERERRYESVLMAWIPVLLLVMVATVFSPVFLFRLPTPPGAPPTLMLGGSAIIGSWACGLLLRIFRHQPKHRRQVEKLTGRFSLREDVSPALETLEEIDILEARCVRRVLLPLIRTLSGAE